MPPPPPVPPVPVLVELVVALTEDEVEDEVLVEVVPTPPLPPPPAAPGILLRSTEATSSQPRLTAHNVEMSAQKEARESRRIHADGPFGPALCQRQNAVDQR